MRFDLYGLIHKAQRFHLLRFSNALGRSDLADTVANSRIVAELQRLIEHLRDHARNEETYIHPLYEAIGTAAAEIEKEHHELEQTLSLLEEIVKARLWDSLYSAYNRFLASYLAHLDAEETAQSELLWPNYRDEELLAVFQRFKRERAPALARADLEFMLPALSVIELSNMFRAMQAVAPEAAFRQSCALAEKVLGETEWKQLLARISTPVENRSLISALAR